MITQDSRYRIPSASDAESPLRISSSQSEEEQEEDT